MEARYTAPPSSEEFFAYVEGVYSYPLSFSTFLDLQSFLQCLDLPHFQHFLIPFPGDLDLPLDLDLPPDPLFLFLSSGRPLTDEAYML